jgi:hypothetical protein
VWGYDELCRFIDNYPEILRHYLHLTRSGSLIAELMDLLRAKKSALAEIIQLYLRGSFGSSARTFLAAGPLNSSDAIMATIRCPSLPHDQPLVTARQQDNRSADQPLLHSKWFIQH